MSNFAFGLLLGGVGFPSEGGGTPPGFSYLVLNGKYLTLNGKFLMLETE